MEFYGLHRHHRAQHLFPLELGLGLFREFKFPLELGPGLFREFKFLRELSQAVPGGFEAVIGGLDVVPDIRRHAGRVIRPQNELQGFVEFGHELLLVVYLQVEEEVTVS